MRVALLWFSFIISLYAVKVEVDSDDLNTVFDTLSSKSVLANLRDLEPLTLDEAAAALQVKDHIIERSSDTQKLLSLQNDLQKISTLNAVLDASVRREEVEKALQQQLFKLNAHRYQTITYAYAMKVPSSEDRSQAFLEKRLAQELVRHYGISQTKFRQILKDMRIVDNVIETKAFGTIERVKPMSFQNSERFDKQYRYESGVVTFHFYPFKRIERYDAIQSSEEKRSGSANSVTFNDVTKIRRLLGVSKQLSVDENENIQTFLNTLDKVDEPSTITVTKMIANDIFRYKTMLKELFRRYDSCTDLACLDQSSKKLIKENEFERSKELAYVLEYPKRVKRFRNKVTTALNVLIENIENDTRLTTADSQEELRGANYKKSIDYSVLKPIIVSVEILPFYESDRMGLVAKVEVSHQSNQVCSQYLKGKTKDKLLGVEFAQIAMPSKELAVSVTEVTNQLYENVLKDNPRIKGCQYKNGKNYPVTCINQKMINRFIEKLNAQSKDYGYRLPQCQEWQFLTTCNDKVKSCWGNGKEFELYEHLQVTRYGFEVIKTGKKKPSPLSLYDLCGNATEFCMDKRSRLKMAGTDQKSHLPVLLDYAPGKTGGFRIIREEE